MPENRIVPGQNAEDDQRVLAAQLKEAWDRPVDFETVPYMVQSSGDVQSYQLGVFYSTP
ncbi:hypothetical protein IPJ72_05670 [Candidatus Peregrinibacteria bacterium]|nr:MAG: hypothetical protein IPJ72_05670 [Candidatus Peregrinibacteria bacterium]